MIRRITLVLALLFASAPAFHAQLPSDRFNGCDGWDHGIYTQGGQCPPDTAPFPPDLAEFHRHYDHFVRQYYGCPAGAVSITDCNPNRGVLDSAEYRATREAAKKLFGLEDNVKDTKQ